VGPFFLVTSARQEVATGLSGNPPAQKQLRVRRWPD
jgi:hypothetical protein